MIEISSLTSRLASDADAHHSVKLVGIGGAGSNMLDRVVLDGFEKSALTAVNTDVQSLTGSVAGHKVQLGRATTRGLGAGGDPELGLAAAEEATEELREALGGASMVFLCAGLGGGTGSGAAPFIAQLTRAQNSLVIAFVTMPFSFEGRRRRAQAEEALEALRANADAVICFENDRMADVASAGAAIQQAFATADHVISQAVRSLCQLFHRPGLLRIGFDELAAVLRGQHQQCIFGYGEGEGDTAAHEAVARALKSPLLDKGTLLEQSPAVIVNVVGGPEFTLIDAHILMQDLMKHIDDSTLVHLGVAVDPHAAGKISVMILGGLAANPAATAPVPAPAPRRQPAVLPTTTSPRVAPRVQYAAPTPEIEEPRLEEASVHARQEEIVAEETESEHEDEQTSLIADPEPAQPAARTARAIPAPVQDRPGKPKKTEAYQENLPFEPVSRGRFDKSEPTIVDGEDLDVPTFMRRNVRVK